MELKRADGRSRWIFVAWLIAGFFMFMFLRGPDVSRSQEARVLETAREMLGGGWRGWLVPHLNGHVRLEKPPLAYWLAAGSFKIFGVGPANGRLPFAVLGWLAIALVYGIGRDLYNRGVGIAAAAGLMASYMFFRHARLAETDGPATLFVAAAIWWLWKGLQPLDDPGMTATRLSRVIDLHLSAIAWALALLSKQGTALYPLVFFVLWVVIERRWQSIGTWLISGAPLTLIIIGVPWFWWIGRTFGWHTFFAEAQTVAEGSDHHSLNPFIYVPMFLMATLPWVGVMLVALVTAIAKWKTDARLRFLLLWPLSIALPLCFIGNKQSHYLMPLLPPVALITAWFIERSMQAERRREDESSSPERRGLRWVVGITLLVGIFAAGAVFFVGGKKRGDIGLEDVLLSPAILLVSLWGIGIFFRRPAVAALFGMCATALLFPYVIGRWIPSLNRHDHRVLAVRIHHRLYESNLHYCFYGPDVSLPLGWTLRQAMPQYRTEAELRDALAVNSRLVVIVEKKNADKIPPVPPPLELILEDRVEDQDVRVYFERSHRATAAPITNPASHATRWLTRRSASGPAATRPR